MFLKVLTKLGTNYGHFASTKVDEMKPSSGNTKGGSITVPLTSCLTGLESNVLQLTIFVFICQTDQSKQEVNSTVILPPLVFPAKIHFMLQKGIIFSLI